jgi:hypothetical protein
VPPAGEAGGLDLVEKVLTAIFEDWRLFAGMEGGNVLVDGQVAADDLSP